uniref:Uncharacterized protein n=1 Tax=Geladintestivirus 4 TaxID=3233136 RepID=A0AAU8MK51_9CAUD
MNYNISVSCTIYIYLCSRFWNNACSISLNTIISNTFLQYYITLK